MKSGWEVLNLISSIIMLGFFLALILGSISYFTDNYPNERQLRDQLFYIGVGAAIFTTVTQWIEGRIKSINKSYRILKSKKEVVHDGKKRENTK